MLNDVVIFILFSSAISLVLARGFLFEGAKKFILSKIKSVYLEYLLTCPMCMGFWIGLGLAYYVKFSVYGVKYFDYVLAGFLCSAFSILLDRIIYPQK